MLTSLQRLFLVGCLSVQFQRQFCSIPEHLIPSYLSLLLRELIFHVTSFRASSQLSHLVQSSLLHGQFQMWRSIFRVLSFRRPWLSCPIPTLMSFWAWIGLSSTRPRLIVRPIPCC